MFQRMAAENDELRPDFLIGFIKSRERADWVAEFYDFRWSVVRIK